MKDTVNSLMQCTAWRSLYLFYILEILHNNYLITNNRTVNLPFQRNSSIVPWEKIFSHLPNSTRLKWNGGMVTNNWWLTNQRIWLNMWNSVGWYNFIFDYSVFHKFRPLYHKLSNAVREYAMCCSGNRALVRVRKKKKIDIVCSAKLLWSSITLK